MSRNTFDALERNELIQKLIDNGYEELVNGLLNNERQTYTKKSRLNKSGACRVLGWKGKQLEDALIACKEILKNDISD